MFCRIQNLHISQTNDVCDELSNCFVEFKIYISLKHLKAYTPTQGGFVEFKIYISLKHNGRRTYCT